MVLKTHFCQSTSALPWLGLFWLKGVIGILESKQQEVNQQRTVWNQYFVLLCCSSDCVRFPIEFDEVSSKANHSIPQGQRQRLQGLASPKGSTWLKQRCLVHTERIPLCFGDSLAVCCTHPRCCDMACIPAEIAAQQYRCPWQWHDLQCWIVSWIMPKSVTRQKQC